MANVLKMAKVQATVGLWRQGWSLRRIARELGIHQVRSTSAKPKPRQGRLQGPTREPGQQQLAQAVSRGDSGGARFCTLRPATLAGLRIRAQIRGDADLPVPNSPMCGSRLYVNESQLPTISIISTPPTQVSPDTLPQGAGRCPE